MAQDAILVCSDWGYELSDVRDVYQGSIHIFNGDQDLMVPLGLQRCVKRMVSILVVLSLFEEWVSVQGVGKWTGHFE